MRIGFTAAFRTEVTIHARGFLQGIYLSAQFYPAIRKAEWVFYDDNASVAGGLNAAESFIRESVDVVVGHFASESAAAALPLYKAHSIPLILPASTCASLTQRSDQAFRLCASDRTLAGKLVEHLIQRSVYRYALFCDESLHGRQQAAEIETHFATQPIERVALPEDAEVVIFCGRLKASNEYLKTLRSVSLKIPVYLTDDAYSDALFHDIPDPGEIVVFSFPPGGDRKSITYQDMQCSCRAYFQHELLLYTSETISALSLINQNGLDRERITDLLINEKFSTPGGKVAFESGENIHARIQITHYFPNNTKHSIIV